MIFRGRSGPPAPPLYPHLGLSMLLSIHAENAPNLTNRYLGMVLEGQTDRQADRQTGAQTADAKTISGQALYHDCAPQLGSILCRYDTCPTQSAPDLRGSILCMQGTQYAPRESILCMEHFVALHSFITFFTYMLRKHFMNYLPPLNRHQA